MPNLIRIGSAVLVLCVLLLPCSRVLAGGFDSSGQTIQELFVKGNELRLGYSLVLPKLSLSAVQSRRPGSPVPIEVGDMAKNYDQPSVSLSLSLQDRYRCLLKVDQPFRFDTSYKDDTLAYVDRAGDERFAPLRSEYQSFSLNTFCRAGYEFQHRNKPYKTSLFSWILGLRYQEIKGEFSSDLSSADVGVMDNYSVSLDGGTALGTSIGFAYERPDIAFRFSLVYHSQIDHDLTGEARAPVSGSIIMRQARAKTHTPESVNLRIQTGLADTWLGYVNLRWGAWADLESIEVDAGPLSQTINLFKSDTLNYQIGLGKRVSERLSIGGYFASLVDLDDENLPPGIDGSDIRNPQGDRYSLALGAQYKLNEKLKVALGASYFYLKESRFADDFYTVDLKSSKATAVSGSLSWYF